MKPRHMLRTFALAIAVMAAVPTSHALAACPSAVPGSTSEAIKANEQRVLCLLREVEDASRQRKYDADFKALELRLTRPPTPVPFSPPPLILP
jgi:hypothetical protein